MSVHMWCFCVFLCFLLVILQGGHGSMPHDAVDPVVAAAHLVSEAQQIVSRNINPVKAAVVSFGGIRSSSFGRIACCVVCRFF